MAVGLAAALPSPAGAARVCVTQGGPALDSPLSGGAVGWVAIRGGQEVPYDTYTGGSKCQFTILVLPISESPTRYPVRIVGGEYRGLLVSDRTRVPGLVSIPDIEATVRALEGDEKPAITSRPEPNADEAFRELDVRLTQIHESARFAYWILAAAVAAFALTGLALRSQLWGRAALLAAPVAMATALALSAFELARPRTVALVLLAAVALGAPLLAALTSRERLFGVALLAIFAVYAFAFLVSSETVSLAVIGPHPEGGGRFYGFTNLMETLLLAPALVGGALLGRRALIPAGFFVLVIVGSSRLGADGGGVLVFAAGFAFLWLRLRQVRMTMRTLALVAAGAVAFGLALIGLDAALGGASHVTRALEDGPGGLAGDVAHRWSVSAHGLVASTSAVLLISAGAAVLVWVALRRPRYATVDAVLVALAVSLLVNDSPRDVIVWGALTCTALRMWKDVRHVE